MQAFFELLYLLNKAIINIVINHWDPEHVNRFLMLNHLRKEENRMINSEELEVHLQACCKRLESLLSIQPSIGTLIFSEVKTAFIKFIYCFDVSLVV